jgi:hypothetical protein
VPSDPGIHTFKEQVTVLIIGRSVDLIDDTKRFHKNELKDFGL